MYIKTDSHLLPNPFLLSIILLLLQPRSPLNPSQWLDTLHYLLNKAGRCMPPRLLLSTTPRLRKSIQSSPRGFATKEAVTNTSSVATPTMIPPTQHTSASTCAHTASLLLAPRVTKHKRPDAWLSWVSRALPSKSSYTSARCARTMCTCSTVW